MAKELKQHARRLLGKLANADPPLPLLDEARIQASAGATLDRLARLLRDDGRLTVRQLERVRPEAAARIPSVRLMIDAIFAALVGHPIALRDVSAALDKLQG
jgi:hypothetical protein